MMERRKRSRRIVQDSVDGMATDGWRERMRQVDPRRYDAVAAPLSRTNPEIPDELAPRRHSTRGI